MPTYKTPDVYIEEISVFPPSVAEVETAIPAFIGYTEKASRNGTGDLLLKPTKIYSMKEYEQYFGGPNPDNIAINIVNDSNRGLTVSSFTEPDLKYLMYFSIKMFFDNGGGQCYIIAVGNYQNPATINLGGTTATKGLRDGLNALALEDEPTLIVIPEAVKLQDADYQSLVQAVLLQCSQLRDRFAIFDLYHGDKNLDETASGTTQNYLVRDRDYFGNNNLKYGAVYYPFLKTTLNFYVPAEESNVMITTAPPATVETATATATISGGIVTGIAINTGGSGYTSAPTITIDPPPAGAGNTRATATGSISGGIVTGIAINAGGSGYASAPNVTIAAPTTPPTVGNLASFKTSNTALYNFVKNALKEKFVTLPPSGAIAGIYAATDSNRGVWKAPANISLANVIEPVVKLDNARQDNLNVDATTGKSINAIRAFMGKGTLVWGARTMAGNDNEWRYIPVRRFFSVVEESIKKSTYWAVFEPNDANTWVKVRAMIENYLNQKWREGALAGATPKEAFFVKCGLGITMTAQDILEGRMNVEIGMAAVRPAEFVILKFSHKLQTS
jgi:uncharacterized protein